MPWYVVNSWQVIPHKDETFYWRLATLHLRCKFSQPKHEETLRYRWCWTHVIVLCPLKSCNFDTPFMTGVFSLPKQPIESNPVEFPPQTLILIHTATQTKLTLSYKLWNSLYLLNINHCLPLHTTTTLYTCKCKINYITSVSYAITTTIPMSEIFTLMTPWSLVFFIPLIPSVKAKIRHRTLITKTLTFTHPWFRVVNFIHMIISHSQ